MFLYYQDRVILGTDYPFPLGELEPGKLIDSMDDFDNKLKVSSFRLGAGFFALILDVLWFVGGFFVFFILKSLILDLKKEKEKKSTICARAERGTLLFYHSSRGRCRARLKALGRRHLPARPRERTQTYTVFCFHRISSRPATLWNFWVLAESNLNKAEDPAEAKLQKWH